ncbi:MAG: proton-conducting transporter membrane subunit [Pyrinomonadaceae bacterium]
MHRAKAFVVNRIGDFGLILGIFGILGVFGSAEFGDVMERSSGYALEPLGTWGVMSWIALALFVGSLRQVAQIPLFVWLPDAMAGPTPVSALIHAATMVTAGLYLLARTNVIFLHSQTMLLVVGSDGSGNGALCRDHRHHANGHQEGARLLHRFAAGLDVPSVRRGRIHCGDLSRHDPRVFQSSAFSRRGQCDSRHAP